MTQLMRKIIVSLLAAAALFGSAAGGHYLAAAAVLSPRPETPAAGTAVSGPSGVMPDPPRPDRQFPDLPVSHWAYDDMLGLFERGLLQGDADGRLRPDEPISRAQLAKLLVEAGGYAPGDGPARATFADVAPGDWHYPYVEMAYRLALMTAADGLFHPDEPVLQGELGAAAVQALAREYDPAEPVTRAEASALAARHLRQREGQGAEVTFEGHTFRYLREYDMDATAYGAGEWWLENTTYTGLRVRNGIAAVDPAVIPLGSRLYVEGYGFAVAADTGRLIKGDRIDLYEEHDADFVDRFGIQPRRVFLLELP